MMRRGSILLTVHEVSSDRAKMAAHILGYCGAIDVDERSAQYRGAEGQGRTRETTIPVLEEQCRSVRARSSAAACAAASLSGPCERS